MPSDSGERAIKKALVQIIDTQGKARGCGLLVDDRHVVTCAHVVAGACTGVTSDQTETPVVPIRIRFPYRDETPIVTGKIIVWKPEQRQHPSDHLEDIAVVVLHQPAPVGATPNGFLLASDWAGRAYMSNGFPEGIANGDWVDGTFKGGQVNGWVQLLSADGADLQIDHGFSGSGVWDVDLQGFAGIIIANKKRGGNFKPVSYMIPATLLKKAWADLPVKPALSFEIERNVGRLEIAASGKDQGWLSNYLKCVRDAHHAITFLGLPTLLENQDVGIDQLYVEPALATQSAALDRDPKDWVGVAPLSDTVADCYRLVILGAPGTGKSTLVSWLAYHLASDTPNLWQLRLNNAIPLPFVLRDLDISRDITWDGLVDAFLTVSAHRLFSKEQLVHVLEEGSAVLLLDGLDEIGDAATRRRLRAAVQGGLHRYPNCRWLLTSRIAEYAEVPFHLTEQADEARQNDPRLLVDELLDVRYMVPFDDTRIEHFARKWFDTREWGTDKGPVVERKTRGLLDAVRRDGDTLRLSRIPHLLTMMTLIHPSKAELPHGKARLYDYLAEAYLESINRFRPGLGVGLDSLQDKKLWLGRVAFEMQIRRATTDSFGHYLEDQSNAIVAPREVILGWLRAAMEKSDKRLDPDDPSRFLERVRKRSGLMIEREPDQFAFTHLSFQDYFAAVYLRESVTSAEWIVGESAAIEDSRKTEDKRYNRYSITGYPELQNEQYARQVAAGTSSAYIRSYTNRTAWHATIVFLFELIAGGTPAGKKLVREAIFGPEWEFQGPNPLLLSTRMGLLARLAANPHVKWATEIQTAAIDLCIGWGMYMGGGIYGHDENRLPLRILLNGEADSVRAMLERIVHHRATTPSTSGLVGLDLSETGVTDLGPLSTLNHLHVLQLDKSAVVDLRPLAGLANLRELDLTDSRVTDITPLARLTKLTVLWLLNTGVTDVRPLAGLIELKHLSLSRTKVTDLRPLAELTKLERLDLQGTPASEDDVKLLQARLPNLRINR